MPETRRVDWEQATDGFPDRYFCPIRCSVANSNTRNLRLYTERRAVSDPELY